MQKNRFLLFIAVIALILSAAIGWSVLSGSSQEPTCPDGEKPVRELSTNKVRTFKCQKI